MRLAILLAFAPLVRADAAGSGRPPEVPGQVAGWRLAGPVQSFDAKTIFEYMDGAAEPYLDYAFRRLHVAFYRAGEALLAVEMYDMTRPSEAFGIFSNWLDGREAEVGQRSRMLSDQLLFWQGKYYARVCKLKGPAVPASQLVEIARKMSQALGPQGREPPLVEMLPEEVLHPENVRYFHTYDILNALYYVSTANVLHLSEKTDGVLADCTFDGQKVKVLFIRYPSVRLRDRACADFCDQVLGVQASPDGVATDELEPGKYAGVRRPTGRRGQAFLALCFEAATPETCRSVLNALATPTNTDRESR